ncbi:hypothetical protein BDU57DRAFT_526279 [Ampelomyces quisqualis]|uniref:Uncharacterized protein n=1 Tax=Ampelomyces quisqualis TaxID=50730 RepID=A0A6A5R2R9_AMPQU|nr:hypothetical protein BDU57DRAFT_526279 [Ampelomyces quisqualis]
MATFLSLPPEIRNMVYDQLWTHSNRITYYHHPTQTGIIAYYDAKRLWICTNKQIFEEGLEQFRLKAHWNIWPMNLHCNIPYCRWDRDHTIMSPKFARSVSIKRMRLFGGVMTWEMRSKDHYWLDHLVYCCFFQASPLHTLRVTLYSPKTDTSRETYHNRIHSFRVDVPFEHTRLVQACKFLHTIEVNLLHLGYRFDEWVKWIMDTESVESLRANIKEVLGSGFAEKVTTTVSPASGGTFNNQFIHGKQLNDYKLTYSKKTDHVTQ